MPRLAAIALALAFTGAAEAKEFTTVVLAGAGGHSIRLAPTRAAVDGLFSSRERVSATGGFVRVYLLAHDGLPGVPGRFYPATDALCLGWKRAGPPTDCRRPPASTRTLLAASSRLTLFDAAVPTVSRLDFRSRRVTAANLLVAIELAFDRTRIARPAPAPRECIRLSARWDHGSRPSQLCLAARGVYARGRLYPLGRGVFGFGAAIVR